MDPLVVLLIVVVSILTVLLVVVGIQVILILKELRQGLTRFNSTMDNIDKLVASVSSPFHQMGGMVEGVKSGLKVAEAFISWINKKSVDDD